jgi:hypothetical protein
MAVADVTASADCGGVEKVLGLLREQIALFARLESFAGLQRRLVTGDDAERLLSLLAERQKLSSRLQRIAAILEPVRRDWARYRARLAAPQRAEADKLLADTTDCLQRIIESDERDAKVLSVRKETAARTLRSAHSTGRAISAYRQPEAPSARLDCVDGDSQ